MGKGLTITGFVLSLLFFIPFAPLAGLIMGIVALVKAKHDKKAMAGLAIAAIVIGALFTLFQIVLIPMFLMFSIRQATINNLPEFKNCSEFGGMCSETCPPIGNAGYTLDLKDSIYSTNSQFLKLLDSRNLTIDMLCPSEQTCCI